MSTDAEPSHKPPEPAVQLPASHKPIAEVLARGTDASPPLPVDESAAALELTLQREMDARREERFYWILACVLLIDFAMFPHTPWLGILCTFMLEVVALIGLAQQLGNERISILLDYLFHQICEKIGLGRSN